jgi:amino acid adenylation domain-containing protein
MRVATLPGPGRQSDVATRAGHGHPTAGRTGTGQGEGPRPAQFPTTYPRTGQRAGGRARVDFTVDPPTAARISELVRGRRWTAGDVLNAVFTALVHRYTGQDDIVLGRSDGGEFSGPRGTEFVPVRSRIREDTSLEDLVDQLGKELATARGNSAVAAELAFHEERDGAAPDPSGLDILCTARVTGPGPRGTLDYDTALFSEAFVTRLAANYRAMLDDACHRPTAPVHDLRVLSAEEERHLREIAGTDHPFPRETCVHTLVEEQARRTPDAPALEWRGERTTYRELDERSNALARALLAGPLRPGDRIGVSLARTPRAVTLLLAILKAGCAYVPLDPAYPADRLAAIAEGARLAAVVLDRPGTPPWLAASPAAAVPEAGLWERAAAEEHGPLTPAVDPDAVSHLIHTSGSTGRPKGVVIHHRNVVALLAWARQTYTPGETARVLFGTSLNFDLSVFELWCPLTTGGCVLVVENVLALTEEPDLAPTLVNTVPSALNVLLRRDAVPATCTVLNVAGEPLPKELVNGVLTGTAVERLYNLYGPSEDTTYSTYACFRSPTAAGPAIGVPLPGTYAYVTDPRGRLVPKGAVGELLLGGAGLSSGYFGDPEATAAAFTAAPPWAAPCDRLYRTGDLAVWTESDELYFMGRRDNQVKVRGYRIELTEIEAVLREAGGVRDAAALAVRGGGDTRIVCYAEADGATAEEIHAHLRRRLPHYMQPAKILIEDALPLLPNRKVDRRALAAREVDWGGGAAPAELTPDEARVAAVWTDLLGVADVSPGLDFFSVGGHSLLANILAARLGRDRGLSVKVADIYEHRTLAAQARLLATKATHAAAPAAGGPEDRLAAAERALHESARGLGVPGAAFAAHVDGRTLVACHGVDDLTDGRARTPDSRHRATCVNKVVLAYTALMLVDRGLLELDGPLEAVVPEAVVRRGPRRVALTLRHLLSHTGGIDDSWEVWHDTDLPTLAGYVAGFRDYGQLFEPGCVYAYSACGTSIVALAIERVTGGPWRRAVNEMLLGPLGVEPVPDPQDAARYYGGSVATGHLWDAAGSVYVPHRPGPQTIAADAPSSFSVCLTVGELARLAVLALNDGVTEGGERLLSEELARQMRTPQIGVPGHHFMHAWGLGWLLFAPDVFGFISNGSGHHNFVQVFPAQRTALVMQANAYPAFGLYEDVVRALTGRALVRGGQELRYDPGACVGEYRCDGYRLVVGGKGERLDYTFAQRRTADEWDVLDAGELVWSGTGGFTATSEKNILAGSVSFIWPEPAGRPEFVRMGQRLAVKIV